ncbi:hypothetical protein [Vibrio rotiferianus]|uniref:hypothetical protein n=1 Tax=Vibrio rotiferianus TaxID=190895 RepID=UPI000577F942|nr:hypothetical protein [Vibrio rotiferianus]PIB17137.1 hypothetical protein B853_06932 [Vibrio rotiferianus CAIM 577 = LMG 21460]
MDDTPSIKKVSLVALVISLITCGIAFTLLSDHFESLSLQVQLAKQYQIIYINTRYVIVIGASITILVSCVYAIYKAKIGKAVSTVLSRSLEVMLLSAIALAWPASLIEQERLISLATGQGYYECPLFSLASSKPSIEVMVREPELCRDEKMLTMTEDGNLYQLDEINAYLKSRSIVH